MQILNPRENGVRSIGRERAMRYVKSGRAVLAGVNCLRFLEDNHQHIAATNSALGYDRTTERGRMLTRREIKHLPVTKPDDLLLKPVKMRHHRYRNGPVKVLYSREG